MNKETLEAIEKTAERTADLVIRKLKRAKRIKYFNLDSFTRTETLLYLYPKLDDTSEEKLKITKALEKIKDDDLYGIVESRYFDCMTFEEIADIYDSCYQTMARQRVRLVKEVAVELFPHEVLKEAMEQ